MSNTKLNIGCGPDGQINGFDNIDNSKAVLLSKFPRIKYLLKVAGILRAKKYEANWEGVIWMDASRSTLSC